MTSSRQPFASRPNARRRGTTSSAKNHRTKAALIEHTGGVQIASGFVFDQRIRAEMIAAVVSYNKTIFRNDISLARAAQELDCCNEEAIHVLDHLAARIRQLYGGDVTFTE